MIYTNVKSIYTKTIKKLEFTSAFKAIKDSSILFIDTETYAKPEYYNKQELIDQYMLNYMFKRNKSLKSSNNELSDNELKSLKFNYSNALKASAEKHAEEIRSQYALDPHKSDIRLFQIATYNDDIYIFDFFNMTASQKAKLLSIVSKKPICGHNLKFDLKVIHANYPDFVSNELFDTMIAFKIIKAYKQIGYVVSTLYDVVKYFTGIKLEKAHGGDDWSQNDITEDQLNYAIEDVKYLKTIFINEIEELNNNSVRKTKTGYFNNLLFDVVSTIEMKFIKVLVKAELHGITINRQALEAKLNENEKELVKLKKRFDKLNVNTSSPSQLIKFLEAELPNEDILSTSREVLSRYAHYEVVDHLLKVKKLQKEKQMINDYLTKWSDHNDKIFPSFNQIRAATGRMSCYDPNVQQIPRTIKKIFYKSTTQDPAFRIDYPSMEARTGGCIMKDKTIIDIFKHKRDMHIVTASLFLNKPENEITKEERFRAKAANFGFLFGMGAKSYVNYAYQNYGLVIDLEESINTRNKYMSIYKGVKSFHDNNSLLLNNHKEIIVTSLLGRKMLVDSFTNANNYPVQSSAIDILKLAAVIFYETTVKEKIDATIINIVHDELVVVTKKKYFLRAKKYLKTAMETAANFAMPFFTTECEIEEL